MRRFLRLAELVLTYTLPSTIVGAFLAALHRLGSLRP